METPGISVNPSGGKDVSDPWPPSSGSQFVLGFAVPLLAAILGLLRRVCESKQKEIKQFGVPVVQPSGC